MDTSPGGRPDMPGVEPVYPVSICLFRITLGPSESARGLAHSKNFAQANSYTFSRSRLLRGAAHSPVARVLRSGVSPATGVEGRASGSRTTLMQPPSFSANIL